MIGEHFLSRVRSNRPYHTNIAGFNRTGTAKEILAQDAITQEQRWEMLSTKEKVGDWASRHRWHLFVACWGASMVGSWLVLRRNTTQTFSQKIVQARVYVRTLR